MPYEGMEFRLRSVPDTVTVRWVACGREGFFFPIALASKTIPKPATNDIKPKMIFFIYPPI